MKTSALNISYFLLTPILFFSLSFIPAAPTQSSPMLQEWEVKYETGTEAVKHGRKMKVTVGSSEIFCRSDKGEIFSVPVSRPWQDGEVRGEIDEEKPGQRHH